MGLGNEPSVSKKCNFWTSRGTIKFSKTTLPYAISWFVSYCCIPLVVQLFKYQCWSKVFQHWFTKVAEAKDKILCLTEHLRVKTEERLDVELHSELPSTLASRPGIFIFGENLFTSSVTSYIGPRSGMEAMEKKYSLLLTGIPRSPTRCYTDWATAASFLIKK
jgi:hypothetical protein